jgi:dGTPase
MSEPEVMPTIWFARSQNRDEAGRARVVCDYIAGMTDRYAIEEHRKLFQLEPWS